MGKTALILGIAGVALFFAGFTYGLAIIGSLIASVLAVVSGSIAYKDNHSDKKALIGKILGLTTFALLAILLILLIALFSSWSWG